MHGKVILMKKNKITFFVVLAILFLQNIYIYAETDSSMSVFDQDISFENEIVADPLQPYNRFIASVNDKMYFWALKPVATGYSAVLPEQPRIGIRNFFHNLTFPIRFVNSILQFKFEKAGIEIARFVINSTMGIAGLADPAKSCFCIETTDEDFGQTLGFYKIGSIFHIEWPFLGPSNLRDSIGYVGDWFLNPINYLPNMWVISGIHIFEKVNNISLHLGDYEKLKKESLDYYLNIRDSYEQLRKKEIKE